MRQRILAALLCLELLLTPAWAAEGDGYLRSGSLDMPPLSEREIAQMLAANPLAFSGETMARQPSLSAPYDPGQVSQAALDAAVGRFNALRRLAGVPGVWLDEDYNARAQYGAVLLAANGSLSHHPAQPADMDDDFYARGHNATSSSNIYQGTNATLTQAVDAFFDDSDGGNLPMLGHRRWMLNPTMAKTGMGFSPSNATYGPYTYNFATLWAFDRSGDDIDYDFIAWPASGSFPESLFHADQAWSVTLNPSRYAAPSRADLTVTLTREGDGASWTLSGAQDYPAADRGAYLGVDTANYGVANAIIFRPDLGGGGYEGTYTVSIQGLKNSRGEPVPFAYQVDFFDPDRLDEPPAPAQPSAPLTAFADVAPGSWYEEAVAYAVGQGLFNGVGGDRFDPDGPMTRAMVMTVLARLDGEETAPQSPLESWDIRGRRWAVTNRISDGLNTDSAITLEELATMLYRYAQLRRGAQAPVSYHLPNLPDGNAVSSWAADAANWAVDAGILIGDQEGRLNPQRTATRAQVATLLQRFLTA